MTLEDGQIVGNTAGNGGGVYVASSSAVFTQTGASTITHNDANSGAGVYVGYGSLILEDGQIVSNTAEDNGGGVCLFYGTGALSAGQIANNSAERGGGVYMQYATAAFTQTGDSAIAHNTADPQTGGGIHVNRGSATLEGGQVLSNTAALHGGGIYVCHGSLSLGATRVISNAAQLQGGGLYVWDRGDVASDRGQIINNRANSSDGGGIHNRGTISLLNTTLSGNTSEGAGGGLMHVTGTVTLTYTTVASNTANLGGEGIHFVDGTVLLQNTIVAYNGASNCNAGLTSNGHNLEDGDTCGLSATTDLTGTDPLLDPLTYESGTWVHPLRDGSPAIDGGLCMASVTTMDQRGVARPEGAECDIGACEWVWRKVYLPLVVRNH